MAKKKIKKFLKKAAPLLAIAGLGKAFMNARNRKAMIDSASADDGFGFMKLKDFGPYSSKKMNAARNFTFNPAMMLQGVGDDPIIEGIQAGAKKGGRIMKTKRGGKAVRGFAKKKKQANRMRKK
jgi:hypothetical protein